MLRIPGVYVDFKGDLTELTRDFRKVREMAKQTGTDISNGMKNAVMPSAISTGIDKLYQDLSKVNRAASVTSADLKKLGVSLDKNLLNNIRMTDAEFLKLQQRMLNTKATQQAERAIVSLGKAANLTAFEIATLKMKAGDTSGAISTMATSISSGMATMGKIAAVGAGIGVAFGVAAYSIKQATEMIFEAGRATKVAENVYKEITGSVSGANKEFEFLRETSDKLGLNFYTMRDGYKGFLAAAQHSKIPMEEVREIFKSISNAGAILGLSNERMSLTFLALEQMMSKGKVSMEEIRRQLGDNLPGAFQIGAKAMGMTVEQFDKAVSAGEVFSEDFLPKFRIEMDKTFKGTIDESVRAVNKLAEAWEMAKNKMASGEFMDSITQSMKSMTEMLKDPGFLEGISNLAAMMGKLVELSARYSSYQGKSYGMGQTQAEAVRLQASGLMPGNAATTLQSVPDEQLKESVRYYQKIEELSKSANEKITSNAIDGNDKIKISSEELYASILTAQAEIESFSFPGGPYKDVEKYNQKIAELNDKLAFLKKAYDEARTANYAFKDSLEFRKTELSSIVDKEISNLASWKRTQQRKQEIISDGEKSIQKLIEKGDSIERQQLIDYLSTVKGTLNEQVSLTEAAKKRIAEIDEKSAEPAKKAAKEQKKLDEERQQTLASINEEYKKLSVSAGGYADVEMRLKELDIAKWYQDQLDILKKTTPELEKTVELKRLLNQQEQESRNYKSYLESDYGKAMVAAGDPGTEGEKYFIESQRNYAEKHKKLVEDHKRATLSKYDFERYEAKKTYDAIFNDWTMNQDDRVMAYERYSAQMKNISKEESESFGKDWKDAFTGWANDWSKSLNDMIWGAETSFRDILTSFSKMLTQMLIQKNVMEPMLKFTGLSGGGGGFDIGGTLSKLFGLGGGGFNVGPYSSLAFDPKVLSFDTGGMMGSDGFKKPFPAIIHSGEVVGTPSQMSSLYGQKQGKSAVTNIVINAVDSKSFSDMIKKNPGAIVSVIDGAMTGNTPLRNTMRGTT